MKEKKNSSGAGKFFLGAALGALVGAIAGKFVSAKSTNGECAKDCECDEDCDCSDDCGDHEINHVCGKESDGTQTVAGEAIAPEAERSEKKMTKDHEKSTKNTTKTAKTKPSASKKEAA